ncbi:Palmitoyltransferase akr1 [Schizosaccharomyces pombe]
MGSLFLAASQGELDTVKNLISSEKIDVNATDEGGATALHWAALNQQIPICKFLLEHGADVNAIGGDLQAAPIHWAAKRGSVKTVHYLVQHGADPLLKDKQGFNCLHLAVHAASPLLVVYLLHLDISVDLRDDQQHTPLMWASYHGNEPVTNCLLRWGADVLATDEDKMTPLHWSIVGGNLKCMKLILKEGGIPCTAVTANLSGQLKTPWALASELRVSHLFKQALISNGLKVKETPEEPEKWVVVPSKFQFSQKTFIIFCFLSSFIITGVFFFIMSICPMVISLIIAPLWIYFTFKYITTCIHANIDIVHFYLETPFLADIFSSIFFWVWCHSLLYIVPKTLPIKPLSSLLFVLISFTCIGLYVRTAFQNPGYVDKIGAVVQRREEISKLLDKDLFNQSHYCLKCFQVKPPRSYHCGACKRCINRYDHHCPWTGNCVGARNHRTFLLFVFTLSTLIPIYFYVAFYYLQNIPIQKKYESYRCLFISGTICQWSLKDMFVLVASLTLFVNWCWVVVLAFTQIWQVAHNVTTAEFRLFKRYGTLVPPTKQNSSPKNGHGIHGSFLRTVCGILGLDQCILLIRESNCFVRCFPSRAELGSQNSTSLSRNLSTVNPYDEGSIIKNCKTFWKQNFLNDGRQDEATRHV